MANETECPALLWSRSRTLQFVAVRLGSTCRKSMRAWNETGLMSRRCFALYPAPRSSEESRRWVGREEKEAQLGEVLEIRDIFGKMPMISKIWSTA
jgi:hypothetical protein